MQFILRPFWIWSCDLRVNERPRSDHQTWGPMRGLEKITWKGDIWTLWLYERIGLRAKSLKTCFYQRKTVFTNKPNFTKQSVFPTKNDFTKQPIFAKKKLLKKCFHKIKPLNKLRGLGTNHVISGPLRGLKINCMGRWHMDIADNRLKRPQDWFSENAL